MKELAEGPGSVVRKPLSVPEAPSPVQRVGGGEGRSAASFKAQTPHATGFGLDNYSLKDRRTGSHS